MTACILVFCGTIFGIGFGWWLRGQTIWQNENHASSVNLPRLDVPIITNKKDVSKDDDIKLSDEV